MSAAPVQSIASASCRQSRSTQAALNRLIATTTPSLLTTAVFAASHVWRMVSTEAQAAERQGDQPRTLWQNESGARMIENPRSDDGKRNAARAAGKRGQRTQTRVTAAWLRR